MERSLITRGRGIEIISIVEMEPNTESILPNTIYPGYS